MKGKMPNLEEHKAVAWYVLERPLVRPDTSYKRAALYITIFIVVNLGIAMLLNFVFERFGILLFFPEIIYDFYTEHQVIFFVLLCLIQFFIGGMIALKPAIIGAIRLYQRYAPERIRRKCLCKPTCSEYAILVIRKYGVIRGVRKIYYRLFKKCRGRYYMIDEP